MEDKELEKKLQESADKIEAVDFKEIWDKVKDTVEKGQPPKKAPAISLKRFLPVILSACLVICCAIGLPLYFNSIQPPEIVYYLDELGSIPTEDTAFKENLAQSDIEFIEFSEYSLSSCFLFKTQDEEIKGGKVDVEKDGFFIAKFKFYHKSVKLDETGATYDSKYTTPSGAEIEYRQTSSEFPDAYTFDVKANYKSVNYLIKLTYFEQDITQFLTEFFS